jgi:hypothetical protein
VIVGDFGYQLGTTQMFLLLNFLCCNKLPERARIGHGMTLEMLRPPGDLHGDLAPGSVGNDRILRFRVPHEDQLRGHFGFAAMFSDALRCAGIRSSHGFLGRFHGDTTVIIPTLRIPCAGALAGRGVHNLSDNFAAWCPHQYGLGTRQLSRLNRLSGLKKRKDSCIQCIAVSR